jgi:hypothetical protein
VADYALHRDEWKDRALCAQADPEEWFPEKGGSTRQAKKVCGRCPVRQECLDEALENHDFHGIRGGYAPKELQAISLGRPVQTRGNQVDATKVRHRVDNPSWRRDYPGEKLNPAECAEAVKILRQRGESSATIQRVYGLKAERYEKPKPKRRRAAA